MQTTMPRLRQKYTYRLRSVGLAAWLAGTALMLTGCGGSGSGASSGLTAAQSSSIHGTAFGGRQPIASSVITAYAAGATPGAAAMQIGQANTNASGSFDIALNPTPSNGQLIYLTSVGGNAGGGTNTNIALLSALGAYGSSSFPSSVNIDELSTVASIADLQQFITFVACSAIIGNTNSGTCIDIVGATALISRASSINNLVNITTGAPSLFLSDAASGTPLYVTLQKLDTLANILASCVNSSGGVAGNGSACGNLFSLGATANNTLVAVFNIETNATENANGTGIYGLQSPPLVYQPQLTAAPTSWTVAGTRYAYVANSSGNSVSVYSINSTSGALTAITGSPFPAGANPISVTLDPSGKFAYVANQGNNNVSAYTIDPATGALTAIPGS